MDDLLLVPGHVRYVIRADTVSSTVVLDSLQRTNPPLRITIDTVFAQARAILADTALRLRIVYATSLPYPKVVGLLSPVGFDGDYTDSVSDFVPLR
ncbi:MAG TPA: hypothetical protein VGY54_24075 [Polyangiaceae bacterium]|nr:hypothetical protein [Polyangiaceae bacterium]